MSQIVIHHSKVLVPTQPLEVRLRICLSLLPSFHQYQDPGSVMEMFAQTRIIDATSRLEITEWNVRIYKVPIFQTFKFVFRYIQNVNEGELWMGQASRSSSSIMIWDGLPLNIMLNNGKFRARQSTSRCNNKSTFSRRNDSYLQLIIALQGFAMIIAFREVSR